MNLSNLSEETWEWLLKDCKEDVDYILWIAWSFEQFGCEKERCCDCVLILSTYGIDGDYFERMLPEARYEVELLEKDHCCGYCALWSEMSMQTILERGGGYKLSRMPQLWISFVP